MVGIGFLCEQTCICQITEAVQTHQTLLSDSQHTRISPRSSCDVMVAGTSLPASGDGCLTTGPTPQLVSVFPLHLAEAPEIPTSCLEQIAVRCKQCYLEYKVSPSGYSETRMERCRLHASLCNNKFFFYEVQKKSVYVFWYEVHSSQTCLFLWDYKLSQEVVHPSVDINTMNMLASYLHTLQVSHCNWI